MELGSCGVIRGGPRLLLATCRKMGSANFWVHTIAKKEELIERVLERPETALELEGVEIDPTHSERWGRGLERVCQTPLKSRSCKF